MKEKIISTFFVFLIVLGFFNYKFFTGNYYNLIGNIFYNNEKYFMSLIYHKKAYNYSKSDEILYNVSNDYYKINDYENSLEIYKKMVAKESLGFNKLYNLGNLFYRLGEKYIDNKIELWTQSINYYKEALSIEEEEYARNNYEFVLNELNSLKKQQEDKQEDDNQQEKQNDSEETNNSDKNLENKQGTKENNKGTSSQSQRDEKYKLDSNSDSSKLSDKERKDLKNYENYLKAVEANNQIFFNKKSESSSSHLDVFKEDFAGDPFFDSVFDDGGEKDW